MAVVSPRVELRRQAAQVLHFLDKLPRFARWSASARFRSVVDCRAPRHVQPERVQRSVSGILFKYQPPLEQGGWLDGWDAGEAPTFLVLSADLIYDGWCKPKRAFYKVRKDNLLALWLLADDDAGRGIVHVV